MEHICLKASQAWNSVPTEINITEQDLDRLNRHRDGNAQGTSIIKILLIKEKLNSLCKVFYT